MADGADASRKAFPFRITDPERIPAKRYYDEEFYRLECERLWPHVWQMACRLEQIPKVGDWTEYANLGKSVIVVRTRDGVKAYDNACRHRGVKLAEGHGNCQTQGFICPFHGWRWNMEGQNTFVYGRSKFSEHQLEQADLALPQIRVELWGGCAFINYDDNAPSFRESIGPLADRLEAYPIDKLRSEWWYGAILPANWKIAMEAFMEGFHTTRTHPQLQGALPPLYNMMYGDAGGIGAPINLKGTVRENIDAQIAHLALVSEGMAGMTHAKDLEIARQLRDAELPDDPAQAVMTWYGLVNAEVTRQGRARGEAVPDLNALAVTHPLAGVEFMFPHYFLLPSFSSFASYRARPLGPETCLFEIWSLTLFPEGQEPEVPREVTILDPDKFPPIPRQDFSNIPRQQLGLHAPGFEFMRLGHNIEGMISNYQRIIDLYLGGEPAEKRVNAIHCLAGGFDGPILDLNSGEPPKARHGQDFLRTSAKKVDA
jgi:phenylpropionate dioxygenase-like ring-hydroxylating dioxygenase large terminal subunit